MSMNEVSLRNRNFLIALSQSFLPSASLFPRLGSSSDHGQIALQPWHYEKTRTCRRRQEPLMLQAVTTNARTEWSQRTAAVPCLPAHSVAPLPPHPVVRRHARLLRCMHCGKETFCRQPCHCCAKCRDEATCRSLALAVTTPVGSHPTLGKLPSAGALSLIPCF